MVSRRLGRLARVEAGALSYVLIVDDDAAIGRMMSIILETEGISTEVAPTGVRALELIAEDKPDLVILDLLLGNMSAESIIAAARTSDYSGPVLLCTAMSGDVGVEADGIIRKPFEPEDLVGRVHELIGQKA
jgi:DNA-binding response OmpR family regulator